ncbi:MAG: response regulator, partial [Lachnospiraceae bacterium]
MRIVIVEDETPIREGMGKILAKIKPEYEVVGKASDGNEGFLLIENMQPDLVITDIKMPNMDGLAMLQKLRQQGIHCKTVVLTAYADFDYAKQAIELGIENYLLKPIKILELKKTLQQVEDAIAREQMREELYTIENVFRSGLQGRLMIDATLKQALSEKYRYTLEDSLELFAVYLGAYYEKDCAQAMILLQQVAEQESVAECRLIPMEEYKMLILIIYKGKAGKKVRKYFEHAVIPMLSENLGYPPICVWRECKSLSKLAEAPDKISEMLEWNLLFKKGTLLSKEKIESIHTEPLKYPLELETQIRQAIIKHDIHGFEKCFNKFNELCKEQPHQPKEIKEACVRYCFAVLNTAKEYDSLQEELSTQKMVQFISQAVTWRAVRQVFVKLFEQVTLKTENAEGVQISSMVKRARAMIQEYYNQGITLEEIARRLSVSEEYLSTQF